jgi:hypothetical protein
MHNAGSKQIETGSKFNRFTVVRFHYKDERGRRFYLCKCECGTLKVVQGSALKDGHTKSCGCYGRDNKHAKLLPNNRSVINFLILQYKRHAKDRKIIFNLTFEEFEVIIRKSCYYCGLPPSNNAVTKNCKGFLYSGIDRVNSVFGYNIHNCVPCCSFCNRAKMDKTETTFLDWVKRVYEFQMNKEK